MYDIQLQLGVKNISDLTIKEFKGIYDKNYKTRKKISAWADKDLFTFLKILL